MWVLVLDRHQVQHSGAAMWVMVLDRDIRTHIQVRPCG